MNTTEATLIVTRLRARPPFSAIKVEVDTRGWYWLWIWTGNQALYYVGPNLPMALRCMAQDLYKRFGNEI